MVVSLSVTRSLKVGVPLCSCGGADLSLLDLCWARSQKLVLRSTPLVSPFQGAVLLVPAAPVAFGAGLSGCPCAASN